MMHSPVRTQGARPKTATIPGPPQRPVTRAATRKEAQKKMPRSQPDPVLDMAQIEHDVDKLLDLEGAIGDTTEVFKPNPSNASTQRKRVEATRNKRGRPREANLTWPQPSNTRNTTSRPQGSQRGHTRRRGQTTFARGRQPDIRAPPNTPVSSTMQGEIPGWPTPETDYAYGPPHANVRRPTRYPPRRPSVILSWGITFDGSDSGNLSVDEFLYRVKCLADSYVVPDEELCANIHLLLKGSAEAWYWSEFRRSNPNYAWETFRDQLLQQFRSADTDLDILHQLMNLRQGSRPLEEYFQEVVRLRNRLPNPPTERELVQILKKNVHPRLTPFLHTQTFTNLAHLRKVCKDLDNCFRKRERARPPPRVAELEEFSDEESSESIAEAIIERVPTHSRSTPHGDPNPKLRDTSSWICWNCREKGHAFYDCPSDKRNIFCFKCGYADVTNPKCPKCNPGNQLASGYRGGNRHSQKAATTQTPNRLQ